MENFRWGLITDFFFFFEGGRRRGHSFFTACLTPTTKYPCKLYVPNCNKYRLHVHVAYIIVNTVKSVLRYHCHERPPVLRGHPFLAEGPTFQYKSTCHRDHLSCKTNFCVQWGEWSFTTGSTVL